MILVVPTPFQRSDMLHCRRSPSASACVASGCRRAHRLDATRTRWSRLLDGHSEQLLQLRSCRQFLLAFEYRLEQIAHLPDSFQHLVGFEHEHASVFLLEAALHLLPLHGRGYRRALLGSQGINTDSGLVPVVLAPIYEHLPC